MSKPIPFGEWLPDLPSLGNPGAITVTNVIPGPNSYKSFPQLTSYSNSLGARCQGGIVATDAASNHYNYVGDSSALYVLVNQTWTEASGSTYNTGTDDYWEFVNWGNTVIAVNGFDDVPQIMSLGGSTFADLSSATVKAKHIATMRDFVVMGNVSDSATNVYRVRWCAINNPNSWSVDASLLADFQDLPSEGGPVQKVLGGEYGVIMQEKSIWRMNFIGSPSIFNFDKIHNRIGAMVPQAAVRYQNLVFFLSDEGFYSFDGSQLKPIGNGKVDKFFLADFNRNAMQRIHAVVKPDDKICLWAYPSNDSAAGNCDKLIIYSWAYDRWALVTGLNVEYVIETIATGVTLDGLDALFSSIDSVTPTLDSFQWTGGQITLSAFDSHHVLNKFNGSAMAATIQTGEFQLFPDNRAMITTVRPDVEGLSASLTITLINRNNLTESASVGYAATVPNATGFVPVRASARYFRVQLDTGTAVEFTHLMGVEVDGVQAGRR